MGEAEFLAVAPLDIITLGKTSIKIKRSRRNIHNSTAENLRYVHPNLITTFTSSGCVIEIKIFLQERPECRRTHTASHTQAHTNSIRNTLHLPHSTDNLR